MTGGEILVTAAAFAAGCAAAAVNTAVTRRLLDKNANNLTKLYFIHTPVMLAFAAAVGAGAWALGQNVLRCAAAAVVGATVLNVVLAAAARKKKK
ncbi:MAG: hypothetical protein K5855_09240 [Oscillospiraceae bacterium]|nr:hypothetical protein [Oscillospiraceae bacterium]